MRPISVSSIFWQSIEDLYAHVSNPENDPEWCEAVLMTELTSGQKRQPGSTYRFREKVGRGAMDGTIEILDADPPRCIRMRATTKLRDYAIEYRLEETDRGTRLTQISTPSFRGPWRHVAWLFRPTIRAQMRKQFAELERALHAMGSSAA